jgi:hypothetical protein
VPDFVEFAVAVAVVLAVVAAVAVFRWVCWSSKAPGAAHLAASLRGGAGMLQGRRSEASEEVFRDEHGQENGDASVSEGLSRTRVHRSTMPMASTHAEQASMNAGKARKNATEV